MKTSVTKAMLIYLFAALALYVCLAIGEIIVVRKELPWIWYADLFFYGGAILLQSVAIDFGSLIAVLVYNRLKQRFSKSAVIDVSVILGILGYLIGLGGVQLFFQALVFLSRFFIKSNN